MWQRFCDANVVYKRNGFFRNETSEPRPTLTTMNTIICTLSVLSAVLLAQAATSSDDQLWEAFKVHKLRNI